MRQVDFDYDCLASALPIRPFPPRTNCLAFSQPIFHFFTFSNKLKKTWFNEKLD
jgi:hypothetical protein